MTIRITRDGSIEFVYRDELRPLFGLGKASIRRASHVEPTQDGRWQADLMPIGGPKLVATRTRSESVRAEIAWIECSLLGQDG